MLSTLVTRRAARLLTAAVSLTAVAACNDRAEPDDDPGEEVESMWLVVTQGTTNTTYTIATSGTVTPSPLRVPAGQSTVTATFLRADGSVVSASDLADFRLELSPRSGSTLTFTRTGPFVGTLNVTASNGTVIPVTLCLFHAGENHCDFGDWQTFSVTVGS